MCNSQSSLPIHLVISLCRGIGMSWRCSNKAFSDLESRCAYPNLNILYHCNEHFTVKFHISNIDCNYKMLHFLWKIYSHRRKDITIHISGASITNRRLKSMRIDHFGDRICFTYPKDKRKSQMFSSADIKSADVAETLRTTDAIKICAEQLREDCKIFDFELAGSFNSAEDVDISYTKYIGNRPQLWERFFNIMFPYRPKSTKGVFQMIHYILHNDQKQTPFHISLAELIHDNSRSKILVQILNKLGLCISYDELEKIDFGLAQRVIDATGTNRTPVPPPIESSVLIHGAMDNFDHDERTSSGIGGNHDTIVMLFQNSQNATAEPQ